VRLHLPFAAGFDRADDHGEAPLPHVAGEELGQAGDAEGVGALKCPLVLLRGLIFKADPAMGWC